MIELSKDDSAKAQAVHATLAQTAQDFRLLVGAGEPAPILELSKDDTATLLAAYNALVQARQDVESFHQHILQTYIAIQGLEKGAVSFGDPAVMVPSERAAFQHFRYTEDYRFIPPK
jgi:hypothetical protein